MTVSCNRICVILREVQLGQSWNHEGNAMKELDIFVDLVTTQEDHVEVCGKRSVVYRDALTFS